MKSKVPSYFKKQSGYTMIEVLLVLMLMIIVVAAITLTYFTSSKASQLVLQSSTIERKARTTIYTLTRELRETTQMIRAESDYITFNSDINSDQVVEEISYYLQLEGESYNLYKIVGSNQPVEITKNIINSDFFSYYYSDQQQILSPVEQEKLEDIGIIGISLSMDSQGVQTDNTTKLDTHVSLRNNI
ncbi:MAG: prepilin-type N-terminal cleavage/methylation domain-containing protein [Actinomycetia bacterium]|nr:prepilin-type N-terminal cleavage/methylation domain-containing protein [Actinomycetes bacterium]